MAENTKISWCHHTFNAWRGCTKVSEGCKHCYAETLSKRNPQALGMWGPQGTRVMAAESYWKQPLKWDREAKESGKRRRVFCASLADVFEGPETCSAEAYKVIEAGRRRLFELILETPSLDWLLLTKRPENIIPSLKAIQVLKRDNVWDHLWNGRDGQAWRTHFPNVWIGTSVENQAAADKRIPALLEIPAAVRFLSCEPLLGPVNLEQCAPYVLDGDESNPGVMNAFNGLCYHPETCIVTPETKGSKDGIHWVIAGGESGPHARPMHPDWARSLRDQCQAAKVAFHFKQWGEWAPVHDLLAGEPVFSDRLWHTFDPDMSVCRVGKASAGRLLDGRTWDELPEVQHA